MAGFMTSAAASGVMGFLTKGVGSKLVTYIVIIYVLKACMAFLLTLMPAILPKDLFGQAPRDAMYFINMLMIPTALSSVISAMTIRWMIRRIPIVGG